MTDDEGVSAARKWKSSDLARVLAALRAGKTTAGWESGKDLSTSLFGRSVGGTRFLLASKAWNESVGRGPLALLTTQLSRWAVEP
jgi:hypothetical protein